MKCSNCGHSTNQSRKAELIEHDSRILVVRGVPCHICPECGEVFYNGIVLKTLESIEEKWKYNKLDISIVNFNESAA